MSGNADTESTENTKPGLSKWLALPVVILLLAGAYVFIGTGWGGFVDSYHALTEFVRGMGNWGKLAIIGLMIAHCFIPFPAEFVAIAAGSLFGTVEGTLLTWSGAMLGALLSFGLTRWLGRPFVEWVLPDRQRVMLDKWTSDQGAMTLLVSRFIPIIAFNLINYAAGLTRVSLFTFAWTTGIGIFPLTALMVYMGAGMRYLSVEWLIALSAVGILVMAVAHVIMRRIRR